MWFVTCASFLINENAAAAAAAADDDDNDDIGVGVLSSWQVIHLNLIYIICLLQIFSQSQNRPLFNTFLQMLIMLSDSLRMTCTLLRCVSKTATVFIDILVYLYAYVFMCL